ncbi:hypothetical protein M406DRAFT_332096 [Cryphonectria parasitica EP155]|uniref:Uncharacterized protein n=1 Tax=Cryphonectria parasitica (strain ATCC 38755 / EP155) TaxID=660469 RepID=A0A9P5CN02_CRYP1|nr:uncharacterized protein M406DRAFT_332096 [Cryphonectria parasitica EP155]KAF3763626.1 hypothetical protein M406DRAFT_332096 [Cryphonectria parasitica EP155]
MSLLGGGGSKLWLRGGGGLFVIVVVVVVVVIAAAVRGVKIKQSPEKVSQRTRETPREWSKQAITGDGACVAAIEWPGTPTTGGKGLGSGAVQCSAGQAPTSPGLAVGAKGEEKKKSNRKKDKKREREKNREQGCLMIENRDD